MTEAGYVYVLINASMEGLVKIGRTAVEPAERASELGATTGVPTPFVLIFDAYFADSGRAEEYVHTLLEQKGYRVSPNREFFRAPTNEAVKAVLEAQAALGLMPDAAMDLRDNQMVDGDRTCSPGSDDSKAWRQLLAMADDAYYGRGDSLADKPEALRLYKQAARLGSSRASLQLGRIYLADADIDNALVNLKEGARGGAIECYAEMAETFARTSQLENAEKCWNMYFEGDRFLKDTECRGLYGFKYVQQTRDFEISPKHLGALVKIRDEVSRWAVGDPISEARVRYYLYPEIPREKVNGRIGELTFQIEITSPHAAGWTVPPERQGLYAHPPNICHYFPEDVVGRRRFLPTGQEVEFEIVDGEMAGMLVRLAVNIQPV